MPGTLWASGVVGHLGDGEDGGFASGILLVTREAVARVSGDAQ